MYSCIEDNYDAWEPVSILLWNKWHSLTIHIHIYSWRCIKKNFLHHFHKPHLNLLVWILITKLAPTYYWKLDLTMNVTGQYHKLSCWRKQFKQDWNKLTNTAIMILVNDKYRPDPVWWVYTCPPFVHSCFLICKHLVQAIQPVPPIFSSKSKAIVLYHSGNT